MRGKARGSWRSKASAAASTRSSRVWPEAICSPIGVPIEEIPQGIDTAGWRVRLKMAVLDQ